VINIPIGEIEFKTMSLTNVETGEEVMKLDGIQEVEITTKEEVTYAERNGSRLYPFYNPTTTMTFTTDEPIDTEKFYKVIGYDPSKLPDKYDIQFQKFVQARKHKKRRINKKWLKRYGYKVITVDAKGWKMHLGTDGTVEFIKV
jgi:hypothetical protein